jgi:predicted Zn-dependent protease
MPWQAIINDFRALAPAVDFWSIRLVADARESLGVRQGVVEPPGYSLSRGAHLTFIDRGAMAYGATGELTREGLRRALDRALEWMDTTRRHALFDPARMPRPRRSGRYATPVTTPWESWSLSDKLGLLLEVDRQLHLTDRIVDRQAKLGRRHTDALLVTSEGTEIEQRFDYILPGFAAVANAGAQTQLRTGGGWGSMRQGGLEQLADLDFPGGATRVAEEALALLDAPECPTGKASVLLLPSQMALQIHESIGHPLELDRILGDERNYAGSSFVSLDMFGHYRYGSELLNVTFDPDPPAEMASYGFDDEGNPAERRHLIRLGILERPLGGGLSQARAGLAGVAAARACDWSRPAIDRMANLNLEPGSVSLEELVASIEHGVLMETNRSWSIDDSRNKFQFGCELGRLIRDGELRGLVRNPSYRGISATFWRSLAGLGDASSSELWGTPSCGKGEPNQMIHVGHASPPCVFHDVEIFGGA